MQLRVSARIRASAYKFACSQRSKGVRFCLCVHTRLHGRLSTEVPVHMRNTTRENASAYVWVKNGVCMFRQRRILHVPTDTLLKAPHPRTQCMYNHLHQCAQSATYAEVFPFTEAQTFCIRPYITDKAVNRGSAVLPLCVFCCISLADRRLSGFLGMSRVTDSAGKLAVVMSWSTP